MATGARAVPPGQDPSPSPIGPDRPTLSAGSLLGVRELAPAFHGGACSAIRRCVAFLRPVGPRSKLRSAKREQAPALQGDEDATSADRPECVGSPADRPSERP